MPFWDNFGGAPSAPQPQAAPAALPQNYSDFVQRLIAARTANEQANPNNLLSWLTGAGRDAAKAGANVDAPSLWQQFQTGQTGVTSAQLGTAKDLATTGALTNTNIDPNNISASVPSMQAAYSGVLNGAPTSQATQATLPSGAPTPSPQSSLASPSVQAPDPVAAQRAMFLRMGEFAMMKGDAAGAVDFFKQANAGVPADTVARPDGSVGDGVTGQPVGMDVGKLLALRAGGVSGAQSQAELPAKLTSQTHQGNVDVGVHSVNANTDSAHTLVNGIDTTTGQPVTRTQADLLKNGTGNFATSNPFFDGQQSEIKELRAKNESADQGLNLAQQISNAANGVYTGKGANALQDVRKFALAAGNLAGITPDKMIPESASQFEQLKFAGQQLVAVASHDLSPRVAMNIYNQIAAVKPGDQTSVKGLRDIINKELIPVFQRNKALFTGTTNYYRRHPMSNDAASVVGDQNPLASFGVRDVHAAQPGDFFIDPQTGNLRQRPK